MSKDNLKEKKPMDKAPKEKGEFRKPNSKRNRVDKRETGKTKGKFEFPKSNDPAFYNKYRELTENASRIAFSHRNGSLIQCAYGQTNVNRNIDPIMTITFAPIPGRTASLTSGINMSANAAYKVLNRKYRGSPSSRYQAADLGISQFGIMDFYLSLAQAERIYGLCQVARVNQRMVPRELVFAAGFDYVDISNNLANFRARLNALIVRAQVLCLVKGYSLLSHHMFLVSNVFKDKDTARANYIIYNKPGFWLWSPTEFNTGSALKWMTNRASKAYYGQGASNTFMPLQTIDDVIYNLDTQLNALIGDSDIDAMCADILALFDQNDSELIKLSFIPDGYTVEPMFSDEALRQLHNTVFPTTLSVGNTHADRLFGADLNRYFGTPYPTAIIPTGDSSTNHTGLYVYQVDGMICFDVHCANGAVTQYVSGTSTGYGNVSSTNTSVTIPVIDTDILNPTPDEVVEMTRQTSIWYQRSVSVGGSTYYTNYVATIGTVLIGGVNIVHFAEPGVFSIDSNGDYNFSSNLDFRLFQTVLAGTSYLMPWSKFDWAPILYYSADLIADLDNYRGIDYPVLLPIHEAATLSEFHNPIADILIKDL